MTGTTSGMGRNYMNFDHYKNQEWLRRRKLRLEQVRKQSNEVAKALRQKLIDYEKARLDEYEKMSGANIRDWKVEKLAELEWKLRSALEEFGESHRQAEEEYELEEITEEKKKINLVKAQKRGEFAQQEEFKKKKMTEEKKMSAIKRKQLARKKEDLRSVLVCSVPLKKQLIHTEEVCDEKCYPEKLSVKKVKEKNKTSKKSCLCKHKTLSDNSPSIDPGTVWINLNEIQTCENSDSGVQLKMSKSCISNWKNQKEKSEGTIEFYDFSSRYHSKTLREFPHVVERIDLESEVANANELAEIDEKTEKEKSKKKVEVDAVTQERGMEALRREKIQRNYSTLIAKLEELNKKEKILKAQQRNVPRFLHMNDERLSERARNKQRLMDAKFESIYFEATAQIPQSEPLRPFVARSQGGGDYAQFDDEPSVLQNSFSPSNLKLNTPVMSRKESSPSISTEEKSSRAKKTKKEKQLLLDIDRALKEGRQLRKMVYRNWEMKDLDGGKESDNRKSNLDSSESSLPKEETKMVSQESQTDDLKEAEGRGEREDLKPSDKAGDESFPVSSATSYKSPPSVIRSYRLRQFLASLDGENESDDETRRILNCSANKNKVNNLFYDVMKEQSLNKLDKDHDKAIRYPALEYYIEKLLSMSRECIADLSVSSENVSTPNVTDLDVKDGKVSDVENSYTNSSQEEDLVGKSTKDRTSQLEETIKNWKKLLVKNSEKALAVPKNVQIFSHPRLMGGEPAAEPLIVMCCPDVKNRYEEITRKCSERISELSYLLDKVRRDKEKLLSSTSGGSSLSLNKDEKASEKGSAGGGEEEKIANFSDQQKASSVFESFVFRSSLERAIKETASTNVLADSQSFPDPEESLESWPDVMDELLKKEILTSPFKWSDGECPSEFTKTTENHTKPSSIETVIGKFRKEIKKIKPFSLSDSFPQCESQVHSALQSFFDEGYRESASFGEKSLLSPSQMSTIENVPRFQEESSVESINHALTSLGLNWAKSFLRKNEESRAMSSSSNSEEKSSEDEDDGFD